VLGVLVAALGSAGLVRAALSQAPAAHAGAAPVGPIVVTNAYVRQPVPPSRTAAAYFTVANTTGSADRLLSVSTTAGATAVLHTTNRNGSMTVARDGAELAAHAKLALAPGRGHVMIQQLHAALRPGQHIELELDFAKAGPIDVVARVISYLAPIPGSR
jgi:copper(I)-binding protein